MDIPWSSQAHLSVGNINLDIVMLLERMPSHEDSVTARRHWIGLGGSAANHAVAVSRLGAKSSIAAVTGEMARSLGLLSALSEAGVDTSHVLIAGQYPGVAVILSVPSASTRTIVKSTGSNSLMRPDTLPSGRWDHIHLSSVHPGIVEAATRIYHSSLISYDPGGTALSRPEDVLRSSALVDYLLVNERELEALVGGSNAYRATRLLRGRVKAVVVKLGVGGAIAVTARGLLEVTPPRVDVADTTGAGDAFNAAFNVWVTSGASLEDSLRAGVAAGAAKVGRIGSSNMPSLSEVLEVMSMVAPARRLSGPR